MRLRCGGFLFVAMTLGCGIQATPAQDNAPTNGFTIAAGPVLQCPTENSMRVTWLTDQESTGVVEYGPVEGELRTAHASAHGLVEVGRLHSVALQGLQPGTVYRYRVISREIVSFAAYKVQFGQAVTNAFQRFSTLDTRQPGFSFLVLNDVHDQANTIPDLLKAAGTATYDFVVMNGDIVSHTDTEQPVFSILKQAAASFAGITPMFWVRGNHETRGSFARRLPAYLGLPEQRFYYAFDHGPAHFVVLDAGEDKVDTHREYHGLVDFSSYRQHQAQWLKAHVRTAAFRDSRWRIVICHMPFPSEKAADPDRHAEKDAFLGMADVFNQFGRTLEEAGVDLMLSGHMHVAAVIAPEPGRHRYPIVQGGGNRGDGRTVTRVSVSGEELKAVILRPDGSELASCQVPATR